MLAILHEFLKWLSDNNLSREGLYISGALLMVFILKRGGNSLGEIFKRKNKDDKNTNP